MSYMNDLQYYLDSSSIGVIVEILLVTSCMATIVFIATKNQYISYLSSAPIFYFISKWFYQNTHLIFIVLAMTVQALIILCIQKKQNSNEEALKSEMIKQ
ncbi:hypothetical protein ACIQXW_07645 [Lysinibacillus sp. NPDC097162]|uniref:hypothetical protein n=1 Tax=unclassified Lysinibacillus TaxID=2636778 RepID=UPI003811820C